MNLKQKLMRYMRNKSTLFINGEVGRIEEVGEDYIVFRWVVMEVEEGWFSSKYKASTTDKSIIPFAKLSIEGSFPNIEWAVVAKEYLSKLKQVELERKKKK